MFQFSIALPCAKRGEDIAALCFLICYILQLAYSALNFENSEAAVVFSRCKPIVIP